MLEHCFTLNNHRSLTQSVNQSPLPHLTVQFVGPVIGDVAQSHLKLAHTICPTLPCLHCFFQLTDGWNTLLLLLDWQRHGSIGSRHISLPTGGRGREGIGVELYRNSAECSAMPQDGGKTWCFGSMRRA